MENQIIQTEREMAGRVKHQIRKPRVYEKIMQHDRMIKEGKSVAFIQLEYDYRCNLRCEHCYIEDLKKDRKEREKQGLRNLTVEDVKNIADQADAMNLASMCISGGESLIFPNLVGLIKAIGPERFSLSMDTSGWFLDENKVIELVDLGVDRVHLSIDGNEENHDKFRKQEGSWQRCMDALQFCHKHGLGVIINIVVTKSMITSGELVKQLEFINDLGLSSYSSLIYAKKMGNFQGADNEILNTDDHNFLDELTEKYNTGTRHSLTNGYYFKCFTFKKQFAITGYGDVMPCPWIPISFGNLLEEPLQDIVTRGLEMEWFSYDYLQECLCGNVDSAFYQKIMPQIDEIAHKSGEGYPVPWTKIEWFRELAKVYPRSEFPRTDYERRLEEGRTKP